MRINRLFGIIYTLLNKKVVSMNELANNYEVSVRTIYRDVEILSQSIPIYTVRGKNGGITLTPNYTLDKSLLSKDEKEAISFSLKNLQANGNLNIINDGDSLNKINEFFNSENLDWLKIETYSYAPIDPNIINTIKQATINKQVLEIEYSNVKGETTLRLIEPLKLVLSFEQWYLYSYCLLKKSERIFKVSRIKSVKVTDQHFDRVADGSFQIIQKDDPKNKIDLVIEVDLSKSYKIFDLYDQSITEKTFSDGVFKISTPAFLDEWLIDFLLSFGQHLKVISPVSLKDELIRRHFLSVIRLYGELKQ